MQRFVKYAFAFFLFCLSYVRIEVLFFVVSVVVVVATGDFSMKVSIVPI